MKNQLKVVTSVLMIAVAGQAMAATNWLTKSYNPGSITVGTATATPTAWSDGAGGALVQQLGDTNLAATDANTTTHFAAYSGGGLGINNSYTPEAYGAQPAHAIDNNGPKEMVLLSFTKAINLTSLTMGYVSGDADFTIMAFNVNGAVGAPTLAGKTWGNLGAGWTVIGDYQNSSTGTKTFANSYYSSYWLIGAYNPLVGTGVNTPGFVADTTSDYFKLSSVAGTVCTAPTGNCGTTSKVPEPGSLALLGLGLVGMIRLRKARKS